MTFHKCLKTMCTALAVLAAQGRWGMLFRWSWTKNSERLKRLKSLSASPLNATSWMALPMWCSTAKPHHRRKRHGHRVLHVNRKVVVTSQAVTSRRVVINLLVKVSAVMDLVKITTGIAAAINLENFVNRGRYGHCTFTGFFMNNLKVVLVAFALMGCSSTPEFRSVTSITQNDSADIANLSAELEHEHLAGTFDGMVLVASGQQTLFKSAYGYANRQQVQKNNATYMYDMG